MTRRRAVWMVAGAGLLFSTLGLGVRLMEGASAWQIVFARGLFQAAAITVWLALRHRGELGRAFRRIGLAGGLAAVALGIAYNGMIVGLSLASVASVVFLLSTAPLLTSGLARAWLGEAISRRTAGAMAMALLGVAVMLAGEPGGGSGLGLLAAAVAALGISVFSVALRRGRQVDMLPAVALAGVAAAAISAPQLESLAMSGRDLAIAAYLGASLAVGLALYTAGSRVLSAAELPLLAMTETVLAPVWVWIAIGETVRVQTLLGGAVVLFAVWLQGSEPSRAAPRVSG